MAVVPAAHAASGPEWIKPVVPYTTTTLEFQTMVGPNHDQACNVEADLRVPSTATAKHPAPAILTSNGFGGSKDSTGATASNASFAMQYAGQGYVTLSYSGLGFGGSTCNIELDSPTYDGQAGSVLVSFLGGDLSHAFTTYTAGLLGTTGTWSGPVTTPPPVQHDSCNHAVSQHCGSADPFDPRVGMIGGSYGGENQLAVADVDPRVDTIIPQITWNDLVYSLAPNNQGSAGDETAGPGTAPVTQTEAAPGVEKQEWTSLFFGIGAVQPLISPVGSQPASSTCPGFDSQACTAKAQMDAVGYPDQTTVDFAHSASAGQYLSNIHIPVFLSQGQDDTLFNLREAITTFKALAAQPGRQAGTVKMMWQQWGHSGGPVAGEADATTAVPTLFDDLRYSAWFARYLRGDTKADTGSTFEYLAPWIADNGSATTPDTAQYLGASTFPVGQTQNLFLSGGDATGTGGLVSAASQVTPGAATFTVSPVTTTSYTETSGVDQTEPVTDAPGTFAAFSSPPLTSNADQVGSPTLTVNLSAPEFAVTQSQPTGQLVIFAKLYDVAPDGTITLANRVISPTRVTDVTKPVTIHLPAVVHRYPAGDHLELVLSSGDTAYKGNDATGPVQVVTDANHVNTLTMPFTDANGAVFPAG